MMFLLQLKGNSSWLSSLSWDAGLFPVFRIEWKHWLLGLELAIFHAGIYTISSPPPQTFGLGLELHHLLSWGSSLLTSDLRTSNHPDQVSQFLMINICLSILLVLFLWRTLTNTVVYQLYLSKDVKNIICLSTQLLSICSLIVYSNCCLFCGWGVEGMPDHPAHALVSALFP